MTDFFDVYEKKVMPETVQAADKGQEDYEMFKLSNGDEPEQLEVEKDSPVEIGDDQIEKLLSNESFISRLMEKIGEAGKGSKNESDPLD